MRILVFALAATLAAGVLPVVAQSNAPATPPANAQTMEQMLQQELDAERAINAQLRARVQQLENMLNGVPAPPALQPLQGAAPSIESEVVNTTAIREALISKGLLVLPAGTFRAAVGATWVHNGSGLNNTRGDTEIGSVSLFAGLPLESMLSVSVPYVNTNSSFGTNSGFGDITAGITKQLAVETDTTPSVLLNASYTQTTGKDPFSTVPIGSGFPSVGGSLLLLKTVEPVVLYGSGSYGYTFPRQLNAPNLFGQPEFMGRIKPGASYGYRFGASLAATPSITFAGSISGAFNERTTATTTAGTAFILPATTLVFLNFGAGFLLSQDMSLLLNASAGVTGDTPNFVLSATVPFRF